MSDNKWTLTADLFFISPGIEGAEIATSAWLSEKPGGRPIHPLNFESSKAMFLPPNISYLGTTSYDVQVNNVPNFYFNIHAGVASKIPEGRITGSSYWNPLVIPIFKY